MRELSVRAPGEIGSARAGETASDGHSLNPCEQHSLLSSANPSPAYFYDATQHMLTKTPSWWRKESVVMLSNIIIYA